MGYLTEDQELMLDSVKEFIETDLRPRVQTELERDVFPFDVYDKMKELGLHNLMLPVEYGGAGEGMTTQVAIVKEIAKENLTMALLGTSGVVASLLVRLGTDEQKALFLPDLVRNPGGFAFTEPVAGSDISGIQTTAVKDGDEWVINGQKTFITGINQCDWFLIAARTNETGEGGISTFLVGKDMPGFKIGSIFRKLGIHASDTGELFFEDLRVPAVNMIGRENKGMHSALGLLDEARLSVGAAAIGVAEAALAKAAEYVKDRIAFGRPLATKQGLQWYAAEMYTKISAANALMYDAARKFDEGKPVTVEAAMLKLYGAKVAQEVTDLAVNMCGGYGLMADFGMERLYRDAKVCSIIEGTDEVMKMVVSRAALS